MSGNQIYDMREFIVLTEAYAQLGLPEEEDTVVEKDFLDDGRGTDKQILSDLKELVFKLRSYTENADGDLALGIETGMDRAAEMVEHLIARHSDRSL